MGKDNDELRPEYKQEDLGAGVRGKYYQAYRQGTNLVLLSPDVAAAFPTEQSVNEALRSLIKKTRAPNYESENSARTGHNPDSD